MPGCGTTDTIFILRQLQKKKKRLQKKKNIYFAFADLVEAFDCVPQRIFWWAMQKLRINQWIIQIVKSMHDNAHSKVRIINSFSNVINVSVRVHQEPVLSSLLFIINMEALSCEFRTGCPWEVLYTNDLAIVAESLGELMGLENWKDELEEKGFKVKIGKTKVLCSRHDVSKSKIASVKFPCGLCMKGAGVNSILSLNCGNWVHKQCSGIKTRLGNCEDLICKICSTTTGAVNPFPTCITIVRDEFEIVSEFCYHRWYHRTNRWLHWCCECLYWISLEGFSQTSTNTHKHRYVSCKPWKNI